MYYIKGKDIILSDFLSRQKTDGSNSHEIILISFSMREVLQERYYNLGSMTENDKYLVQTRSQANSSGVKLLEVHGVEKGLVLHIKPERQKPIYLPTDKRLLIPKPRLEQGRARIKRKARVVPSTQIPIQKPAPKAASSLPEPVIQSQERAKSNQSINSQLKHPLASQQALQPIGPRIEHRPIPFYPDPILRPPLMPSEVTELKDIRKDLLDLDTDRTFTLKKIPHTKRV